MGGVATTLGRRLIGNGPLRRVLIAFLLFSAAEYGTWVAILLYAYERTGPLSVGLVALIQLVPAALAAPAASALGDRFPRERVLAVGYAIQALAMFATGLTMLADAPPLVTYAVAAATAASLVVTRPTQSALLPSLAMAPADCTIANGASGFFEGGGQLIGPLAAAAILAVGTPATVFFAASLALVVALLVTVGVRPRMAPIVFASDADDVGLLGGLRLVLADRDARVLVGLLTARMLVIGACDVLFVLLALELLGDRGAGGRDPLRRARGRCDARRRRHVHASSVALASRRSPRPAHWYGAQPSPPSASSRPRSSRRCWLIVGAPDSPSSISAAGPCSSAPSATRSLPVSSASRRVLGWRVSRQAPILVPILVGLFGLVGAVVAVGAILPVFVGLRWPRLSDLERGAGVPARGDLAPSCRDDLSPAAGAGVGGRRASGGLGDVSDGERLITRGRSRRPLLRACRRARYGVERAGPGSGMST